MCALPPVFPPLLRATVLPIVNGLLEFCESMLAEGRAPPLSLQERPDGQWVATVWPRKMVPAFFPKFRGEVWLQQGKAPTQGQLYRRKQQQQAQQESAAAGAPAGAGSGGVSLVLGECGMGLSGLAWWCTPCCGCQDRSASAGCAAAAGQSASC
jgi:hypothetical protein